MNTPHFRIISNAPEKDARHAALQFERMRSVFARVFPNQTIDPSSPMVVLALQNKADLRALEPASYLANGQATLLGWFLLGTEENYIVVLLNAPGQHPYAPIFHEYAHFVQTRSGEWMPLWLGEGWAEFYQTAEIQDTEVLVGKLDTATWQVLQHNALLPLPTLLSVDVHSPYYHEEDKTSVFYAESWALTHYIETHDALDNTHHLQDYLDLVHKNVDPVEAAIQAFGDLTQLQTDLQKYITNPDFQPIHIAGSTNVDDSSFETRPLTQVQVDTIRAAVLAYDNRAADARQLLDSVLREDPKSVSACETMGLIFLRQGNFDEAQRWYDQALKLDPQSLLANCYFALAVLKKGLPDASTQHRAEAGLRTAIKINPQFAQAYYELGLLLTIQGKDYPEARRWFDKAIDLYPGNVEYRLDYANLLIQMHKNKDAGETLQLAAKMAHTPEQTAEVENVLQSLHQFEAAQAKHPWLTLSITNGHGNDTVQPRTIYSPQAEYTEEARAAHREGVCTLSLIVGLDGKTSNISVVKKLGYGLDEKAVEAVSKWRFEPARKNGRPAMTRLTLNLEFKLLGNDRILQLSERVRAGDPAAEFELAKDFFEGKDIPQDEAKGAALLERAARDGLPEAQFQMAERAYGNGGDPGKYVTAYIWYTLAQRTGFEPSQGKAEIVAAQMTPEQLTEAEKQIGKFSLPASK